MQRNRYTVAVLGANGMLGSIVTQVLQKNKDLTIIPVTRVELDAEYPFSDELEMAIGHAGWVINCIGTIKPRIKQNAEEAIRVNSLFPHRLAKYAKSEQIKVIQIATDCVFSGQYYKEHSESSVHDATDVYGKTKSLGEVHQSNFYNVRCSIIGPKNDNPSLLEWFLHLPEGEKIDGYTTHYWNGITTLAFAKICEGILVGVPAEVENFHLVPADTVSKHTLISKHFRKIFDRGDIEVRPVSPEACNRELTTEYPQNNERLWKQAGYEKVPTIEQLLIELKTAMEKGEIHG